MPQARSAAASSPGREHLGQKLSVLYRTEESQNPFNEVVGLLQRVEDDEDGYASLLILRKSGEAVQLGTEQIVSWKVVPPIHKQPS